MKMRRDADSLICCELSVREREAIESMKVKAGFATDANLLRSALYRFAVHLDERADTALFAVRNRADRPAARKARTDAPGKYRQTPPGDTPQTIAGGTE